MTAFLETVDAKILAERKPDWMDFYDEIPDGATFYTRRGWPHKKTSRGSATELFDPYAVDEDSYNDASVFDDWPFYAHPLNGEASHA